jgi:hypothetical protein
MRFTEAQAVSKNLPNKTSPKRKSFKGKQNSSKGKRISKIRWLGNFRIRKKPTAKGEAKLKNGQ